MIKRLFSALKTNFRKLAFYYLIVSLLTILVLFPDLVFFIKNSVFNYAVSGFVIVQLLLLIPVVIFCRRMKIYYWILGILSAFIPFMLFPVFYMNIQVNAEMVGLVLDTNVEEAKELLGWKIILVILAMAFILWLFIKLASKLPSKLTWRQGVVVSLIGIIGFALIPLIRTTDMRYYTSILRNTYRTYYPYRMQSIFSLLHSELGNMERYKKETKNFTFNAVEKDTSDHNRKIFVMIIGEASRADHWHINGYQRETSPEIEKLNNFVSFKDAVTGGTMTILSVPQLITRATPEDYEKHTREKSILAAFKEAGYYTAWVSNQSHYGLSGNIGMHFTDGDTAIYSSHGENETNFTGSYDESILPLMSDVINKNPKKNIFILLHLIGSHWRYILRYPPAFQKFVPTSDRNRMNVINPTKEEIVNEYDNSILYSDYILKCIADTLRNLNSESGFLFVSDHGESLDDNNDNTYFHSYKPVKATAVVPFFVWLDKKYVQNYPQVYDALRANANKKVSSAVNAFYTMIDIGRLSISGFDSSASLANPVFREPEQNILGDAGKIYKFKDLK